MTQPTPRTELGALGAERLDAVSPVRCREPGWNEILWPVRGALCPSCGTANPPGHKFCGQCAAPLSKAEPRFASPESYTPNPEVAAAESHYGGAMTLASELGMRPLVAHCHLGLGRLYRIDKAEQGRKYLDSATTMYREMDMGFWLGKAEAELGLPKLR